MLNFRTFFRFLGRNKVYSIIEIFGLSVSLMFVILIAIYTTQELSVDRYHKNGDRIYALANEANFETANRLAYRLQERYPDIEKVTPVIVYPDMQAIYGTETWLTTFLYADADFFEIFSFPLIQGEPGQVLAGESSVVISESYAHKHFDKQGPIGQTLQLTPSLTVTITGIMKDIRNSVVPSADLVLRVEKINHFSHGMGDDYGDIKRATVFVLEKEGTDIRSKTDDIAAYFEEIFWPYQRGMYEKVMLVPLKQVYFSPIQSTILHKGDKAFVLIFVSVGILILLFAVTNYINLTIAQSSKRATEMSTRRLFGSSRKELATRLITESTFLCLLSFLIALVLTELAVPFANDLLQTQLSLQDVITPLNVLITIVFVLLLGFVSGLLPAFVISKANPLEITKGGFRRRTKMVFSKVFITFQSTITIILIAVSITMLRQTEYLINAPLGYKTENIIMIPFEAKMSLDNRFVFVDELHQTPQVVNVGFAQGTPFDGGRYSSIEYEGQSYDFHTITVDEDAFRILGFEKIRDNQVSDSWPQYFTQNALRTVALDEDAESFNGQAIAGVVKDFRIYNITRPMQATIITIGHSRMNAWDAFVEVQGDPEEAFALVKKVFERLSGSEFTGRYVTDLVAESFAPEIRTYKIVTVFSWIAIIISLLGLLAMSTYFIQQQAKEIALKKVLGSSNTQVLIQLVRTFLTYVAIAFVIAVPVILYSMRCWLSDYSYQIKLSAWIFLAAGLFCLVISFITVYWQSRVAANANPIEGIRNN